MVATLVIKRVVSRSRRRRHETVQAEVQKSLENLSKVVVGKYEDTVDNWDSKPQFKATVSVTRKKWILSVNVKRATKAGKIYGWVDKGTGSRGGKEDYEIRPKKAKYLQFTVPHSPITLPNPSIQGFPPTGDPKTIRADVVIHPGIYPRNFTKTIMTWLKSEEPGAFKSVIEAAVKRAFRKISKGETI